jgi:PilZ domain
MDNERRVKSRYPLELKVRYQTVGAAGPGAGVGQTLNISSSGMLLACASNIPEGTRLKLFVEWPSLLNGTTPLQLITVGTVVRCTQFGISIAFDSYQFRTMSRTRYANVTQMPERVSPNSGYGSAEPQPLLLIAKSSS